MKEEAFVRIDILIEKPVANIWRVLTVLNISTGNINQLMIELEVPFRLVILFAKINSLNEHKELEFLN